MRLNETSLMRRVQKGSTVGSDKRWVLRGRGPEEGYLTVMG